MNKIITEGDAAQAIAAVRAFAQALLCSMDKAAPLLQTNSPGNVYPYLETLQDKTSALYYNHDFELARQAIDFLHGREYPEPGGAVISGPWAA